MTNLHMSKSWSALDQLGHTVLKSQPRRLILTNQKAFFLDVKIKWRVKLTFITIFLFIC